MPKFLVIQNTLRKDGYAQIFSNSKHCRKAIMPKIFSNSKHFVEGSLYPTMVYLDLGARFELNT